MSWWLHDWYTLHGPVYVVSWVFWVIFSVVLHELAHGWAALWQGDDTPRTLGHMTWNPLVHMPPMSLIMFLVIGITWGLMPVDPSKYRWKRKGRIVVAGAGPAMNIFLYVVSMGALLAWLRLGTSADPEVFINIATFFEIGAMLNIVLALFNLLPIPPLDGSDILSGLSLKWYLWMQDPRVQQFGFFVLIIVFISGLGGIFWAIGFLAVDFGFLLAGLGATAGL